MDYYSVEKTALVLVDPFNDFLSEGGKLWPYVKQTVEEGIVVDHFSRLVYTARKKKIPVVYAPLHHSDKYSYQHWKFFRHRMSVAKMQ